MDQNSVTANPAAQAAGGVDSLAGAIPSADNIPLAKQTEVVDDRGEPNINVLAQVAEKISAAQNVLVALSSDPSVDEMAAAIGLTMFLDKLGKRATAIYSGTTPNALEFLKPEKTFDSSADTLQDFVVALNKEKADHLRYKLDGDYVKIYITPYRTRISEKDLEFSYGDYNVDLVIALDVANGLDLDAALREHGRIMHDAIIINITTANPGKFGGIEWSDKTASSVSEMIAKLIYSANSSVKIGKEEATAFLTGVVAATNRFSNAKTTPSTMQIASKLMASGANQQLVSKNITPDVENEIYSVGEEVGTAKQVDATQLKIDHGGDFSVATPQNGPVDNGEGEANGAAGPTDVNSVDTASEMSAVEDDAGVDNVQENTPSGNVDAGNLTENVEATAGAGANVAEAENNSALLDDLKAAEASLAQAGGEIVPDLGNKPLKINDAAVSGTPEADSNAALSVEPTETAFANPGMTQAVESPNVGPIEPDTTTPAVEPVLPPVVQPDMMASGEAELGSQVAVPGQGEGIYTKPEKIVQPPDDMLSGVSGDDTAKYGKMLESALGDAGGVANPASAMAPEVNSTPEINGVPEMNYMPLPGQEVLPPPPTPPIDMNNNAGVDAGSFVPPVAPPSVMDAAIVPGAADVAAMPVVSDGAASAAVTPQPTSLGQQPAMQDQVYNPQAADPGAFKIPGM